MAAAKRSRQHLRVREKPAQEYSAQDDALTGVLLDSDVVIEILRGRAKVFEALLRLEGREVPTFCTAITWAEVHAGLKRGEEDLTEAFFAERGEVVIDSRAGRCAGRYLAAYSRSHGVDIADALIAAAASTSGLALWTLNRKHYPMKDVRFYEPE